MVKNLLVIFSVLCLALSCSKEFKDSKRVYGKKDMTDLSVDLSKRAKNIDKRVSKFVPLNIDADLSFLPSTEKKALDELIKASRYIDEIYFRQAYAGNVNFKKALVSEKNLDKNYLEYFEINYGPFDRLDGQKPFIGENVKPKGANFYPADMTKKEFEDWLAAHPEDEKNFKSSFTVIRRKKDGLVAVPYSVEYVQWLRPAADHMRKAASHTKNKSFKKFLVSRADAFLSNDYYQSDIDWMDIKGSPIEITIGPYEVYEDGLFGYKAAFESFVTVINPGESRKLQVYQMHLKDLDQNMPVEDRYKSKRTVYESPIRVAEVVYTAGDARKGVQTIAYNLPNDEKVRVAKGNKQVMLKNFIEAKFEGILSKIAKEVLDASQIKYLSGEAFFLEVLHHELAHSLGPSQIETKDGKKTTVNKALKDKYSTIEEAKADTLGVYDILYLIDKGVIPKRVERTLLPTYLAGIFRSIRFGMAEAHGAGMMIQFNYLGAKKAIAYNEKTQKFYVNFAAVRSAFKDLAHDLLMIEATGDYEGAVAMYNKYGKAPNEVKRALAKLESVPVDIKPVFVAFK